jgi:methionyl-tRNA formyltransferase
VRLVFFGTPEVAVPSLLALARAGHCIAAVVTQPDRPRKRSGTPAACAVKLAAVEGGLSVLQPGRIREPAFQVELERLVPDLLVVVAYGRILPGRMLAVPALGAVNVHFSLLPKYRGAAPVQWALARGETTTGVTTMRIAERLDEGDILLQQEVEILPGEHAPQLGFRLARLGADLLLQTLSAPPAAGRGTGHPGSDPDG